jgi:hypothetical protein
MLNDLRACEDDHVADIGADEPPSLTDETRLPMWDRNSSRFRVSLWLALAADARRHS